MLGRLLLLEAIDGVRHARSSSRGRCRLRMTRGARARRRLLRYATRPSPLVVASLRVGLRSWCAPPPFAL
eukprot:scaffold90577_cov27-Tisochrysis_lutea.AAC.2